MTLREALKEASEGAAKLHKTNIRTAETLVRLYRRVEAQMTDMESMSSNGHTLLDGLGSTGLGIEVPGNVGVDMNAINATINAADHPGVIGGDGEVDAAIAAAAAGQDILAFEGDLGQSNGMLDMGNDNLLDGMDLDF